MKRNRSFSIYVIFCIIVSLSACTKEIDFDYHEVEPVVVIEGRVTNEGSEVLITRTRNVDDSVRSACLTGADVVITADGISERLPYDADTKSYRSAFCGTPGQTYHLDIRFEGQHYEATSTMPYPAQIMSATFLWQPIMSERLLSYEVWAKDPEPTTRNYYMYRMNRYSTHPHFSHQEGKSPLAPSSMSNHRSLFDHSDAYRWNVFDDRGCPPGLIYRDVMCMSEQMAEDDEEDYWEDILYEGDIITFTMMTIDRPTYDFFSSLIAGQNGGGANPKGNITGDACLGYFTATSVTHSDTLTFSYNKISQAQKKMY